MDNLILLYEVPPSIFNAPLFTPALSQEGRVPLQTPPNTFLSEQLDFLFPSPPASIHPFSLCLSLSSSRNLQNDYNDLSYKETKVCWQYWS